MLLEVKDGGISVVNNTKYQVPNIWVVGLGRL